MRAESDFLSIYVTLTLAQYTAVIAWYIYKKISGLPLNLQHEILLILNYIQYYSYG